MYLHEKTIYKIFSKAYKYALVQTVSASFFILDAFEMHFIRSMQENIRHTLSQVPIYVWPTSRHCLIDYKLALKVI